MLGGRAVAPEGMMALWTTATSIMHRACLPSTRLICRSNYWWGCPTASYSKTRFHLNLSRLLCAVYLFFKLLFCFLLTPLKARGPKDHTSSVFHTEKVLELIHFYESDQLWQQKMYFATLCPFSIEKIMLAQWHKVLSHGIRGGRREALSVKEEAPSGLESPQVPLLGSSQEPLTRSL